MTDSIKGRGESHPPVPSLGKVALGTDSVVSELAADGILTLDHRCCIQTINPEGEQMFGFGPGELLGQSLKVLLDPENQQAIDPCHSDPCSNNTCIGVRGSKIVIGRRKVGQTFPMQLSIAEVFLLGQRHLLVSVRDLTEWKAAEERFRLVVESSPTALVMVNSKGMIILINKQAEKTFQYFRVELVGQPVEVLIPERYRVGHVGLRTGFFAAPQARPMGVGRDLHGLRKDGVEFPIEIGLNVIHRRDGVVVLSSIVDITERKQAEETLKQHKAELEQALASLQKTNDEVTAMSQQLWQAAKLASVGELAAGIAHELNNPLATVSLRIESVLSRTPDDDPRRRSLEIINQETQRMGGLVSNLLQFSRRGEEKISTVNLLDELNYCVELIQHHLRKNQVQVIKEIPPDLPTIFADRQKLRQVFLNLLTNASDAMPQGGTLTLRTDLVKKENRSPLVKIEFIDTGVGIAPDDLEHVMDPFFTTKEEGKGTGLGLAICRRIVQEHCGSISIASKLNNGTTVAILIPLNNGNNVKGLRKSKP